MTHEPVPSSDVRARVSTLLLVPLLVRATAASSSPSNVAWESTLQYWRATQGEPGATCEAGVCVCSSSALEDVGRCAIRDCSELVSLGVSVSGQYPMRLAPDESPVQVYCDMETAGGGWTVFQRRQDDPVQIDFFRDWQSYRDGFGNVSGQFWLGNELIHRLTTREPQAMRVDLEDFEGERRHAQYGSFSIADEADQYRLQLSAYSGDAGDSLTYHSNQQFSTRDRDNDDGAGHHCAALYTGAWWYRACHRSNLNGLYLRGIIPPVRDDGKRSQLAVSWLAWKGHWYSLKASEMKIRPANFRGP
ncbi:ficolin-2-like [Pollicipes pollicipes]|uniref:ficolin-2-like n=1 Tax=Pollicipes pollicipes TaxID=41117 RepID=UPI001884A740|nr:ficolin-2-like [Pollicipes pollicipes]